MSLRLKFLILIAGSILTPTVVMLVSFGLTGQLPSLADFREQLALFHVWRTGVQNLVVDEQRPDVAFRGWPAGTSIRVLAEDGTLLYAHGGAQARGEATGVRLVETARVAFVSGRHGTVVMSSPGDFRTMNRDRFYVPLAGLLFFAIMAVLIVQSMNRSVATLERATSRIAAGDLDFELTYKGNDKLASLTRSFDSMRRHLKEEYARRSRFIMGVSHDLKTPLSSISGYVAAIRDGYADTAEKLDRYTAIIGRKASLLESRLSLLIDYVKRDTSEWTYTMRTVNLLKFLQDFARVFELEASLKGRVLSSRLEVADTINISMEEDMVLRAFENLAHNALQHSPAGTPVDLHAEAAGAEVRIAFANEGPGIPPGLLETIFEPFVRGSRDRAGSGLGLGLATVKSVISSHGWSIDVASTPHARTIFTVRIPLRPQ
jgi:signal transduction histidine kinase